MAECLRLSACIYIAANSLEKKSLHVYPSVPANSQLNGPWGIETRGKDPSICIYRMELPVCNPEVFTEHLLCHVCIARRGVAAMAPASNKFSI